MNKQNIVAIVKKAKSTVGMGIKVIKVAAIVAVIATSLIGGYVLTNAELRNHTIDYAQNQVPAHAEGPKAQ
jgi:Na+-transporting NADH:ubiquinone oxidoreductase subunit NqrE